MKREEPVATCEEGLHGGTLSQFDRRLSGVGGQSGVRAVVQEQPDYWQVVARHCVVERPDQRKKTMWSKGQLIWKHIKT